MILPVVVEEPVDFDQWMGSFPENGISFVPTTGQSSDGLRLSNAGLYFSHPSEKWNVQWILQPKSSSIYGNHTLGKKQPMFRALGLGKGVLHVLDATAGLGADTFKLACVGFSGHSG
ncbi:MAG: class I SAM-dependent methyltransferase [Bdellovibrionales bacterium]